MPEDFAAIRTQIKSGDSHQILMTARNFASNDLPSDIALAAYKASQKVGTPEDIQFWLEYTLARMPENTTLLRDMGLLFQGNLQWEEAISYYSKAAELRPDIANYHALLGIAYQNIRKYEEAAQALRLALKIDETNRAWWIRLAQTLVQCQSLQDAANAYTTAQALQYEQSTQVTLDKLLKSIQASSQLTQNIPLERVVEFRKIYHDFQGVCAGHFISPQGLSHQKRILAECLQAVSLEAFSFCNRTCSFCANSFIDRKSAKIFMDKNIHNGIMDQLASFGYSKTISYARYHEALADKIILERVDYARRTLPKANIRIISNGDYINDDYIRSLMELKINILAISVYLPDLAEFSKDNVIKNINKIEEKTGLKLEWSHIYDGTFAEKRIKIRDFTLIIRARNLKSDSVGVDCGGLIPSKSVTRTSPCALPFNSIAIDYNGKVVPCCNLRSDAPAHADYVLGDLNNQTLFDIYFSEKAAAWRRGLFHFSENHIKPCNTCANVVFEDNEISREFLDSILSESGEVKHIDLSHDRIYDADQIES